MFKQISPSLTVIAGWSTDHIQADFAKLTVIATLSTEIYIQAGIVIRTNCDCCTICRPY